MHEIELAIKSSPCKGCKPLAIKFGVDAKTMLDVIRKRTWKHIIESAPEKPSEAE